MGPPTRIRVVPAIGAAPTGSVRPAQPGGSAARPGACGRQGPVAAASEAEVVNRLEDCGGPAIGRVWLAVPCPHVLRCVVADDVAVTTAAPYSPRWSIGDALVLAVGSGRVGRPGASYRPGAVWRPVRCCSSGR
ncbi:hypothetical protein GCM10022243_37450 [Saccharothrix violaceirubra]